MEKEVKKYKMKNLLIALTIAVILIGGIFVFHNLNKQEQKPIATNTGVYYGPVPEGYDQEYFWETGKMIKVIKDGS